MEAGFFAELPGAGGLTVISVDTKTRVTPKPSLLDRSLANRGAVTVRVRVRQGARLCEKLCAGTWRRRVARVAPPRHTPRRGWGVSV